MKNQFRVALTLAGLFICPLFAYSQEGLPSVSTLAKGAEIIVVGMASPVDSSDAAETSINLRVDRAIKGSLLPGTVVSITSKSTGNPKCGADLTATSLYAIWFLNSSTDGNYDFVPSQRSQRCYQTVPQFEMSEGPLPAQFTYDETASSEDKLAYELASTIVARQGDGPWAFIDNPFLLVGASKIVLQEIYTKLERSQLPHVHMAGLIGLTRMGDTDALVHVEANLPQLISTPVRASALARGQRDPITYGTRGDEHPTYGPLLVGAIQRIANPSSAAVSVLGRLLLSHSATIEVRRAAAYALQSVHSALAVQELVPLLADTDQELRAYAIGGLACFANGVPAIGSDSGYSGPELNGTSPYRTTETLKHFAMGVETISQREAFYLDYWQQWWSLNAGSVVGAGSN